VKKNIYFLVVIIGLGWLIAATKDKIAKAAVEKAVAATTGLRLSMDSFSFGILKTDLAIQNLRLFNPEGYKEPEMLYIPRIFVDYNFADLIKKIIHIENMELDLKELMVIKDKNGKLNLSSLKPVKEKEPSQQAAAKDKEPSPAFKIDNLLLKIGKVTYKDYTKNPDSPAIQEFTLNFSGKYTNITDLRSLVKLIVGKALLGSALGNLTGLDFEAAASGAKETVGKTAESLKGSLGGILKPQQTEEGK